VLTLTRTGGVRGASAGVAAALGAGLAAGAASGTGGAGRAAEFLDKILLNKPNMCCLSFFVGVVPRLLNHPQHACD
jgi:hypothetical protein